MEKTRHRLDLRCNTFRADAYVGTAMPRPTTERRPLGRALTHSTCCVGKPPSLTPGAAVHRQRANMSSARRDEIEAIISQGCGRDSHEPNPKAPHRHCHRAKTFREPLATQVQPSHRGAFSKMCWAACRAANDPRNSRTTNEWNSSLVPNVGAVRRVHLSRTPKLSILSRIGSLRSPDHFDFAR